MLIDLTLNLSPALLRRGGDLSAQKTPFRAFFIWMYHYCRSSNL